MPTYPFLTRAYGPNAKGSTLTWEDLDNSLLFLSESINELNFSPLSGSNPWSLSGNNSGGTYTGSYNSTYTTQGGGNWYTASNYLVTESFALRDVKDIEINTNNTVNAWYSSSIPNYGFIVKLTGSQEFNISEYIQPIFKFYSVDINTIVYDKCWINQLIKSLCTQL